MVLIAISFTGALPIPRYSYSNGSDVIIADFVRCNGSEKDLLNCDLDYSRFGDNFNVGFLVGVRCDGMCFSYVLYKMYTVNVFSRFTCNWMH